MNDLKVREFPKGISSDKELILEAMALECVNAKVIPVKFIMLGRWMKLQCQYGCSYYGKRLTCPPFSPHPEDLSEILLDYQKALLIEAPSADRVREIVVTLEKNFKRKGLRKAFSLSALPCDLCENCTIDSVCQFPEIARPTLNACGIDVHQTVNQAGWELEPGQTTCSENYPFGMVLLY